MKRKTASTAAGHAGGLHAACALGMHAQDSAGAPGSLRALGVPPAPARRRRARAPRPRPAGCPAAPRPSPAAARPRARRPARRPRPVPARRAAAGPPTPRAPAAPATAPTRPVRRPWHHRQQPALQRNLGGAVERACGYRAGHFSCWKFTAPVLSQRQSAWRQIMCCFRYRRLHAHDWRRCLLPAHVRACSRWSARRASRTSTSRASAPALAPASAACAASNRLSTARAPARGGAGSGARRRSGRCYQLPLLLAYLQDIVSPSSCDDAHRPAAVFWR